MLGDRGGFLRFLVSLSWHFNLRSCRMERTSTLDKYKVILLHLFMLMQYLLIQLTEQKLNQQTPGARIRHLRCWASFFTTWYLKYTSFTGHSKNTSKTRHEEWHGLTIDFLQLHCFGIQLIWYLCVKIMFILKHEVGSNRAGSGFGGESKRRQNTE